MTTPGSLRRDPSDLAALLAPDVCWWTRPNVYRADPGSRHTSISPLATQILVSRYLDRTR